MAISGMTITQAVNDLVETIGEFPMAEASTPSPTGTSIYSRARIFVRRETKRVLTQGWPENTILAKRYSLDLHGKVALANPTEDNPSLFVQSAGPDKHRTLVMRYDGEHMRIFDADWQEFDLRNGGGPSRTDVFVDEVIAFNTEAYDFGFDRCSPQLQDVIVGRARALFQRRIQGNLEMDTALQQEYHQADIGTRRNQPVIEQNLNVTPNTLLGNTAPRETRGG